MAMQLSKLYVGVGRDLVTRYLVKQLRAVQSRRKKQNVDSERAFNDRPTLYKGSSVESILPDTARDKMI